MIKGLLVTVALLLSTPAYCHTQWANGQSVDDWIKTTCCGKADAHEFDNSQVTQDAQGNYVFQGYPYHVGANRLQPSPDGHWWVFYTTSTTGEVGLPICIFGPLGT